MLRFFQVNFPSKHITELVLDECEVLGISRDSLYSKMSSMGYIGPPMALLCIDKIKKEEKLNPGDILLSFVTEVSKFMQAGYGQWGLKMQDDLTWGAKYLVAHGIADPKRVGIMGGSYGGYMTLTMAGRHPELWSAACDMFGPYDLLTFSAELQSKWRTLE